MASDGLSNICLQDTGGSPYVLGCALLMTLSVTECRRPCSAWRQQKIWCAACAPVAACLIRGLLLTANLRTAMVQRAQPPLSDRLIRDLVQSIYVYASRAQA